MNDLFSLHLNPTLAVRSSASERVIVGLYGKLALYLIFIKFSIWLNALTVPSVRPTSVESTSGPVFNRGI